MDSWGSLLDSLEDARRLVEMLATVLSREPIIGAYEPRVGLKYEAYNTGYGVCVEASLVVKLVAREEGVRPEAISKLEDVLRSIGLGVVAIRGCGDSDCIEFVLKSDLANPCIVSKFEESRRLLSLLKSVVAAKE
ncbi:MAG TPA: hypothetical protein EYH17_01140 [Pyrodictium sp.]|nr:hypothetical protein [Pyrodictium sp.]